MFKYWTFNKNLFVPSQNYPYKKFSFYSWTNLNYRDPGDSLMWLWDVLLKAEEANEKVHIIGHSPPNAQEFISGWAKNYAKVIDR